MSRSSECQGHIFGYVKVTVSHVAWTVNMHYFLSRNI